MFTIGKLTQLVLEMAYFFKCVSVEQKVEFILFCQWPKQ